MKHAKVTLLKSLKLAALWMALTPGMFSSARAQDQPATAASAQMSANVDPDDGRILIEAHGVRPKAPLFFSAAAESVIDIGAGSVAGEMKLRIHVVQGKPEVLTLGLTGEGEVVSVSGEGLKDWAVREGSGGNRFLDLHPVLPEGSEGPRDLELTVRTHVKEPKVPGTLNLLLPAPGDAVGFSSQVTLRPDSSVDLRVTNATGMMPLESDPRAHAPQRFFTSGEGRIEVALARRGAAVADAELAGLRLTGHFNEASGSVDFRLAGEAIARVPNAKLRLLSGSAALNELAAGDGWHIDLVPSNGSYAYELVFDRPGAYPIDLGFSAAVRENGDWRTIDFEMPAGVVVPVVLEGLGKNVTFDPAREVVPGKATEGWKGFLPAGGAASFAWKTDRDTGEGTLFFTTHEQTDVRIGAGLVRQTSRIDFRILQGKLNGVKLRLEGPGEILGVEGSNVLGWDVSSEGEARVLNVKLSRPFEKEGTLIVRSQSALESFPVKAEPLRLTPEGAVRHSGFVRVANSGAVRLEVADVEGMMQLAPEQFPGEPLKDGARQVFVYRFPSATYSYRVTADQILPEVGVSQVTLYQLGETDRVIEADIELDIREAPLRDWSMMIPEDYAVVSVNGSEIVDYVAETQARDGLRALKILFGKAVEGRQLVRLRLEKNEAAAAGDWQIRPLEFPGAKTVRGHIGIVSAPGYRIVPGTVERLLEVPLSYFPKQVPGLQQAYRLKEPGWTAAVKIEALGQSVQADVFHLYSLKEGVAYGSILINYFVVGAPASEWRIEVPESVGNIDVVGQNVRRDWRREGNQVVVTLHQPVLGAATLLITFEEPMSARGGMIHPGEVRPLGVQGERGFVQVVSPLQVKHEIRKAEGSLLKLEPLELPAEYRLLTSSPSLAVYQYTARPFDLEMSVEWYEPGETVDQVVDFAKLASRVSRDGQVVTDARFFVKTRGRKALRMELPEGVKLWEARVDGEVVSARADGGQTLLPIPSRMDPNQPVEVMVRFGHVAKRAGRPELTTPRMLAPTVISEWTVRADPERLLVPKGGSAQPTGPFLTERGFTWLSTRERVGTIAVLILAGLAGWLLRRGAKLWKQSLGLLVGAAAIFAAITMASHALLDRTTNKGRLEYAATVVPAGETVTVNVANVPAWRAMVSWWGVASAVGGLILLGTGWRRAVRGEGGLIAVPGAFLFGLGILAQRGGAIAFFAAIGVGLFMVLWLPGVAGWVRLLRERRRVVPGITEATAAIMIGALVFAAAEGGARAEEQAPEPWVEHGAKAAEAIIQQWDIKEERLFGRIDLTVRGTVGDSFLLLKSPAILTGFEGEGLRVSKVERVEGTVYYVVPEREGQLSGVATFEMPAKEVAKGLPVPTGPAAMQRISIRLDEGGWEFDSPMAAKVIPDTEAGNDRSGATLVLGPSGPAVIQLRPRQRDIEAEETRFFAEIANLYLPGPGVVNGRHRVTVRPAQGQVSELILDVPEGFTVGDVANGPVGKWRFDPEKRKLRIGIEPAQTETFKIDIETQIGTEALPVELALTPLRIDGASGEVGMIALAFGGDAQPENVRPEGVSPVNLEDFDPGLLPRTRNGEALAVLQHVYRYGREGGKVSLRVAPVAAEVRVATRQVLSLGDDRLVLAADLNVAITRAGLFKLRFELPEGLEVEALSGPALSHWTEATEDGRRVVTMHLNGRTIGSQTFAVTLAGAAPPAQEAWSVPRLQMREATRQTGELILVPEKGIRLRAVDRENVSQLDPRAAGEMRPGTLAFRLLQQDWALTVGIEALEPWATVQSLQEVTLREGQTLTRLNLRYRIENASVKHLRIRLPGLSEDQEKTVRATGQAVSDFVKVEADLWEVRFQRGVVGETNVEIEFQGQPERENGRESIQIPVFEGVRQTTHFVAIRGSGRLELEAGDLPRGWQRVDWGAVPANLQNQSDRSVPVLCFRVAEPEGPLAVAVRRHDVADALKLRVAKAELTTVFSPVGPFLTAVDLEVKVIEKSTMQVRLPEGANLFSAFVNGESVALVRNGDAYLFHVSPNTDEARPATVRLVYNVPLKQRGDVELVGPRLSVPLENVSWKVVVPPGYELSDYEGGLRLKKEEASRFFKLEDYQSAVLARRNEEEQKAVALLKQANQWLQQGEQQKAGEALSRASKAKALDEASNEDARVQLRALKTQQAVLGLNTRRQRMYLDNRTAGDDMNRNVQLEEAANFNPFLQGKTNFDPQQMDQLLRGNTLEENDALRGIAGRLVDQQLAAEPAPGAIDVTLPERGQVLTFTRSLQVEGAAPLTLELEVKKVQRASAGFIALVLAGLAAVAAIAWPGRRRGKEE